MSTLARSHRRFSSTGLHHFSISGIKAILYAVEFISEQLDRRNEARHLDQIYIFFLLHNYASNVFLRITQLKLSYSRFYNFKLFL